MFAAALLLPTLLTGGAPPPADAVMLNAPRVEYRPNEASATTSPWIDANGWRILRAPDRKFAYRANGQAAALAAAEAFTYGADAFITADAPGAEAFGRMLGFLQSVPAADLTPAADFGVADDGSAGTGELLNVLTRMNLLYGLEKGADARFRLNVQPGPEDVRDPSLAAHKIRAELGDARSLRIYGSEVVIGQFRAGTGRGRVLLLNYSGRPVRGLRVRVRGQYSKGELRDFEVADAHLTDWTQDGAATEFSIPELHAFAVVDLSRD
jgi:hypothetical protein